MQTIEFKQENFKLYYRCLNIVNQDGGHFDSDGDEYAKHISLDGWTKWTEVPIPKKKKRIRRYYREI